MKRFASIQQLRGLAAMMVVIFHALVPARGIVYPAWRTWAGASGVDIFFVISGFIIYASQSAEHRDAGDFLRRRLVRIMPMYWLVTLALIGLHLTVRLVADLSLDPAHVAQSFLLIPHFNPNDPGKIEPLLVVGWSLQYELFFYGLFAVGLALAPRWRAAWLSVALAGLVGVGWATHPVNAIASTFTDPRLLEFLAGVLLAVVVREAPRAFPPWAWVGIPLGLAGLLASDALGPAWREVWWWGAMAVVIVAGALALDLSGQALRAPLLQRLGDASYSIYLSHLITLGVVRQAWRLLVRPNADPMAFVAFSVVAVVACAVTGVALYDFVERPLLARLGAALGPRRKALAAAAA